MSFLSPEQVRAVRVKGSKIIKPDELEKEIRVIKMSSSATLAAKEIQEAVKNKTKSQSELMVFMMENALADLEGNRISHDDALQLFDLLSIEAIGKIVTEISSLIGQSITVTASKSVDPK